MLIIYFIIVIKYFIMVTSSSLKINLKKNISDNEASERIFKNISNIKFITNPNNIINNKIEKNNKERLRIIIITTSKY
jgi:hypothetical protein